MSKITNLKTEISEAIAALDISSKADKLNQLKEQSREDGFWSDNQKASKVMQKISGLQSEIEPWQQIKTDIDDLAELEKLDDDEIEKDIGNQYQEISSKFKNLKKQLRFKGKYDNLDAILSIHAGAGGTDAQDWAQMLLRMYVRWAESNDLKVKLLEESTGEEAGLKSASLEISGKYIYGKLKAEHGVHRLVRLSPFNANNLRQTSFAKVEIIPVIEENNDVKIDENDLKIDVYKSGGRGGQSVNTTDSAVRITHKPTGIVVAIQNERSQIQNKETALAILRSKLVKLQEEQEAKDLTDIKGPDQSAEWGNQIRNYVLHPYTMIKDQRSKYETTDVQAVLDGELNPVIDSLLESNIS